MRFVFLAIVVAAAQLAVASEPQKEVWKPLIGYTLWDLYTNGDAIEAGASRISRLVSTDVASWPDGRQTLITYIEVEQGGNKWLYRCMDYTDSNFQPISHTCY